MFAKIAILCSALAAVSANILLSSPLINTGISTGSRKQDGLGNYAFNYGIANGVGATNSRSEIGDAHGNKVGAYTITDIDGRARRVDYVADGAGFRASVKTNEPGTALSAPAAAVINSPYAPPVAPAVNAAVGVAPLISSAPLIQALAPTISAYSSVVGHGAIMGAPIIGAGIGKSIIW